MTPRASRASPVCRRCSITRSHSAGGGHVTGFGTGNIILGGDGSDIILGRGGDDVIDGDAWLNVRVSVRANPDGTGPRNRQLRQPGATDPADGGGTYNPGQLVAVREILPGTANAPGRPTISTPWCSRATERTTRVTINNNGTPTNFSDDVVTVADSVRQSARRHRPPHAYRTPAVRRPAIDLAPGLDAGPVGSPTITDLNGGDVTVGDFLRVSIVGVTDPNNVSATNPTGTITGPIRYTWQSEAVAGSGVFDDIILLPGGDLAFESASGISFRVTPDLAGLSLRVKAIYTDAHGVTEQVFSAPTTPVVAAPAAPLVTPPIAGPVATAGGRGRPSGPLGPRFHSHADQDRRGACPRAGTPLQDLIPNIRLAYGLRSVDGSENNLLDQAGFDQTEFGAADTTFPRLLDPLFRNAEAGTSYTQTSGTVINSQPRTISNLIVDQTANNPAAYATAYDPGANGHLDFGVTVGNDDVLKDGVADREEPRAGRAVRHRRRPRRVLLPERDAGRRTGALRSTPGSPSSVSSSTTASISSPRAATARSSFRSRPMTRWSRAPMASSATPTTCRRNCGSWSRPGRPCCPVPMACSARRTTSTRMRTPRLRSWTRTRPTPRIPRTRCSCGRISSSTRSSAAVTAPVATGKLITNRDLGADGHFGDSGRSIEIGGMATWKVVKAQARDLLGINLTDKDFDNVPLLATDQYGNFIKGAHGLPQVVMQTAGGDGIIRDRR